MVNENRIYKLNDNPVKSGKVIYWMSRDQRIDDNWALIYAQENAILNKSELEIVFFLSDNFLGANANHYFFMLSGLQELEIKSKSLNIPFKIIKGEFETHFVNYINSQNAGLIVTDFDPLKIKIKWKNILVQNIESAFHEVDAHNIVPCRFVSNKMEFAAYTIRKKILNQLDTFLTNYDKIIYHTFNDQTNLIDNNLDRLLNKYSYTLSQTPGSISGMNSLYEFINNKLHNYEEFRNNPALNYQSNLSPYLHFGQISSQRVVIEILKNNILFKTNQFLDEIIIRKELSDNFCLYNSNYDSFDGFPEWAKTTLNEHRYDTREYIYSLNEFENANTHDIYWNSAQIELINHNKIHGYMRMYWAKKILEWTETPELALEIAIYLNNKYQLDGRDPNGYAGIAWSIGGVHDRAWNERNIFGKIRYMNAAGLKRKFDIDKYVQLNSIITNK